MNYLRQGGVPGSNNFKRNKERVIYFKFEKLQGTFYNEKNYVP
jgi:hypothetical protein